MKVDRYGNTIVLGLAEVQWPPVILFSVCMLPSRNVWLIVGNAVFWYLFAYTARRWGP